MKNKFWFTDWDMVRWIVVDTVSHRSIRKIIAFAMYMAGIVLRFTGFVYQALRMFMNAHRLHPEELYAQTVLNGIRKIPRYLPGIHAR